MCPSMPPRRDGCGVKAVGSNLGGAAIYASSKSSGQSYPISANTYAGYFDGGVHVNGAVYCGDILSNNYGTGWSLASDGTIQLPKGCFRYLPVGCKE